MRNRFISIYNEYKKESELKSIIQTLKKEDKKIKSSFEVNSENYYVGNPTVQIEDFNGSLQIDTTVLDKDCIYISYLELNTDFSHSPTHKILENGKYQINFIGKKDSNIQVELFIIQYKDKKRFNVKSILLNNYDVININKNEEIRLAIRVSGKGVCNINSIQTLELKPEIDQLNQIEKESVNNFKIQDYNWSPCKKIDVFNLDEWFFNKKRSYAVSTINNEIIIDSNFNKKEFAYISYLEKNVDFSKKPENLKFSIANDFMYKVTFEGKKQDTQRIELYLIFYTEDGKKDQIETVLINESRIIKPKNSVKFFRVAVRISGIGKAQIKNICIEKKKELDGLSFDKLRKLGIKQPKRMKELKVAAICDEFTMQCLKPEVNLITFGPDDWKAIFEFDRPDILFVESAWQGNSGKWTRKVSYINDTNTLQLQELIKWCKEYDIPTVFWNKEDPVHFNSFIKTAMNFDFIFTTDEGSIENYIKNVGHKNVYALPFAAQPILHNPIEIFKREEKSCFAGSYYANKYLERQKDMNLLLENAAKYGLEIFDRNYGKELEEFYFPAHLRKYVVGSLKGHEIAKAYKGYKVALNVNSVIDSPTMFSRRVFECLACNTPVVSTFSKGIENVLGDTVYMAKEDEQLASIFNNLFNNKEVYEVKSHLGYRKVMSYHTYEERLKFVLSKTGHTFENVNSKIVVLSIVENKAEAQKILQMFQRQLYSEKQLIILVKDRNLIHDLANLNESISIVAIEDFELIKDNFIDVFISKFSAKNYYGSHYLSDLVLAFKYAKSEIIGKATYYNYEYSGEITLIANGNVHSYVSQLCFENSVIKVSAALNLSNKQIVELMKQNKLESLFSKGYRLYSADKFNFIKGYQDENMNNLVASQIMI